MRTDKYGKTPETPILLNSVQASGHFLNNLVTEKGYHILYHRIGSMPGTENQPIIDHYEIMDSNNTYEDFYINAYNDKNILVPPAGYLFEYALMGEDYDEELEIDDEYIWRDPSEGDLELSIERVSLLPRLEIFMDNSQGTNMRLEGFPYSLIKDLMTSHFAYTPEELENILSAIKPRIYNS